MILVTKAVVPNVGLHSKNGIIRPLCYHIGTHRYYIQKTISAFETNLRKVFGRVISSNPLSSHPQPHPHPFLRIAHTRKLFIVGIHTLLEAIYYITTCLIYIYYLWNFVT